MDRGLNKDWTTELFKSGRHRQCVQTLPVLVRRQPVPLLGPCQNVQSSSVRIDHRRRRNSYLLGDKGAFNVIFRNSRDTLPQKIRPPERRSGLAVGVEGIDAVVLGRNKEHIVPALARYLQSCEEERLRINVSIYLQRE